MQTCMITMLAVLLVVGSGSFSVYAQGGLNDFPPETNKDFTSETQFTIPDKNSAVTFASGGSYANATINGGIWDFAGLFVNGGLSVLPNTVGVSFSCSAENCNVTITHLDVLNMVPPAPGQLDYRVAGVGAQAFNLHYSRYGLIGWTVLIDGAARAKGDGWTLSADGWLTVTDATCNVSVQWAEASQTAFAATDTFPLPDSSGAVGFALGGSYLGEVLAVEGVLVFQNLALNGSTPNSNPLWNFGVSAQNCNLTVTGYKPGALTGSTNVEAWLNYTVAGVGTQTVNLNYHFGSTGQSSYRNYTVCIDGENRTQSNGWNLQNGGWVTITGATSNVSIYYPPNIPPKGLIYCRPAPTSAPSTPQPQTSAANTTIEKSTEPSPATSGVQAEKPYFLYAIIAAAVAVAATAMLVHQRKAETDPTSASATKRNEPKQTFSRRLGTF
ncbi:MAG: hypothetical protein NWF05_00755 [Candidatus Bathyarchaeota archaeon]|nr:hypothetical protein [Candidatus Bathyarchaeota archaeon]